MKKEGCSSFNLKVSSNIHPEFGNHPMCPRLCGPQNEQQKFVWQDSDSGEVCRTGAGKDQSCLPSQEFSWTGFSKPLEARLLVGQTEAGKPRCSKAWLSLWTSVSMPSVPGFSGPGHKGWSVQAQGTLGKSQFPSCLHSDPSALSTGNGLSEPS